MSTIQRPEGLPSFGSPPLNELVLGIQFDTLGFKGFHAGELATRFPGYSEISEQPFILPAFELFGTEGNAQAFPFPPFFQSAQRYWFRTPSTSDLVQVQPDRLLRNWTRRNDSDVYPRYETIRAKFEQDIQIFSDFIKEKSLGAVLINQCETSYINLIEVPMDSKSEFNLSKIFKFWSTDYKPDQSMTIEDANVSYRTVCRDEHGKPVGRLHFSIDPVIKADASRKPFVQLNLTFRGKPKEPTAESALELIDIGRTLIVKSFASATREDMHKLWTREQ